MWLLDLLVALKRRQTASTPKIGATPAPLAPTPVSAPPPPVVIVSPQGVRHAQPEPAAPAARPGRKTLASVVGVATATLLFTAIPREESGRTVTATVDAQTGQAVVTHVMGKQYLKVYLDIVGVATACDGITTYHGKPMVKGMTFTEAQCTDMLEEELVKHATVVMACTPGLGDLENPRIVGPRFAAVSLAYNIGTGRKVGTVWQKGYCGSSVARDFNALHYSAGCDALMLFDKAGGRVNAGLHGRRGRERNVCLRTLTA